MTQLESRTQTGGERQKIFIKGSSRRQVFTVYDLIISMFLDVVPGVAVLGEDTGSSISYNQRSIAISLTAWHQTQQGVMGRPFSPIIGVERDRG